MEQQFLYKVWKPGQSPVSGDPLLTLHSSTAVQFFVESALAENSLFRDKPFAMVAYHIVHELMRQVAEGTYRLSVEDGQPHVSTLYESGMLTKHGGCTVACAVLIDAIAASREQLL